MQWAEGGSLDDFIAQRRGIAHGGPGQNPASPESEEAHMTRAQRIAAFRARMGAGGSSASRAANLKAVHLLSTEEIVSLLWDITSGLDFLVSSANIAHCIPSDSLFSTTGPYFILISNPATFS